MNVDLTSGNFANILIVGVGITAFTVFLFFPDQMVMFSNFTGYLLSLLVGFCLLPFIRLSKKKFHIDESDSVISCVQDILKNNGIENAELFARPVYDLFLRKSSNASNLTKRLHDLSFQSRFLYSLSRLFNFFSFLLIISVFVKLVLAYFNMSYANKILLFWEYNYSLICFCDIFSVYFFIYFPLLVGIAFLFYWFHNQFLHSTKSNVTRVNNLQKIAIIADMDFFKDISESIKDNQIINKYITNTVKKTETGVLQP